MKYFIKTFGCAMNVSDSERLSSFLESRDILPAKDFDSADLVIFNTCGIKQTAENRAYSLINNLRKEKGAGVRIVMTGCLANRADVQKRMRQKVDLFTEIKNFPTDFDSIFGRSIPSKEQLSYLSLQPKYQNGFQAHVPIMTGCDNFCAYCVVPYARGRETSRPATEILAEVKSLIGKGYKQITLLGQNVNSYRDDKTTFPVLLKKINALPGKFWIQFVSSHPKDMDDELIEVVAKSKKVCEWIHLPVQAGNDEVLRRMNRRYTRAHYLKLLKKIRAAFKKHKPQEMFALSSDIIVGFPGETKTQFTDSALVMEKAKFDMVYFGQFSPRPGTAAWQMKDNVSPKEKTRREQSLNEILKKTALANNKKYVGKKIEILIEQEKSGFYYGKTRTMKNIRIPADKKLIVGTFAKAEVTKANAWNLEGELN